MSPKKYMHVPLMDSCYLLQHCPRPLRHPLHSYPPDKMRFRFLHHLPTSWSISCALSTPYSIHRPLQHHSLPAAPLSTWQHMVRIKTDIIDWLYDLFIDFGQHLPTVLMLSLQLLIIPWKYCPFWKASNNTRPPSWSPLSCQTASAAAARRREHEYLCCMIIRKNSSTKIFRICKQHNDTKKIYACSSHGFVLFTPAASQASAPSSAQLPSWQDVVQIPSSSTD